jgi:hypothetical protein
MVIAAAAAGDGLTGLAQDGDVLRLRGRARLAGHGDEPRLTECMKCQCEPLVQSRVQRSASSNLITSSTVIGMA